MKILLDGGREPLPAIGLIHILAVRISPRPHRFSARTVYRYSVFSTRFSTKSDLWSGPGSGTIIGGIPESENTFFKSSTERHLRSSIVWYSTTYEVISPWQWVGSPQLTWREVGESSWNASLDGFEGAKIKLFLQSIGDAYVIQESLSWLSLRWRCFQIDWLRRSWFHTQSKDPNQVERPNKNIVFISDECSYILLVSRNLHQLDRLARCLWVSDLVLSDVSLKIPHDHTLRRMYFCLNVCWRIH